MKTFDSLAQIEQAALKKLSDSGQSPVAAYIQKAAGESKTNIANREAFDRYQIVPRVLGGVHGGSMKINTTQTVLGERIYSPVMIAPTAWHKMFSQNGEKDTSDAAFSFGTNLVASFYSNCDFAQMGSNRGHIWFNLLPYVDKNLMKRSIDNAQNNRCQAIVLTVDAPLGCKGSAQFAYPIDQLPLLPKDNAIPFTNIADYYQKYVNSAAGWKDIETIVKSTSLPIILKGILHPQDAERAVNVDAKGIIVSNHGGRQMDGVIGTLDALTQIRDWVKPNIDIYLDGGIRSGQDVFKAIALGAKAVLIGRPAIYGLVADGKDGLLSVLDILRRELEETMHMSGCKNLSDINSSMIYKVR